MMDLFLFHLAPRRPWIQLPCYGAEEIDILLLLLRTVWNKDGVFRYLGQKVGVQGHDKTSWNSEGHASNVINLSYIFSCL